MREVNRRTDRQILKIFLPGFQIQREILTDFPDLAIAADCGFIYFLGPDFGLCESLKYFCPYF